MQGQGSLGGRPSIFDSHLKRPSFERHCFWEGYSCRTNCDDTKLNLKHTRSISFLSKTQAHVLIWPTPPKTVSSIRTLLRRARAKEPAGEDDVAPAKGRGRGKSKGSGKRKQEKSAPSQPSKPPSGKGKGKGKGHKQPKGKGKGKATKKSKESKDEYAIGAHRPKCFGKWTYFAYRIFHVSFYFMYHNSPKRPWRWWREGGTQSQTACFEELQGW